MTDDEEFTTEEDEMTDDEEFTTEEDDDMGDELTTEGEDFESDGGEVSHHVALDSPVEVYGAVRDRVILEHRYVEQVGS